MFGEVEMFGKTEMELDGVEYERAAREFLKGCSCSRHKHRPQDCPECLDAFVEHLQGLAARSIPVSKPRFSACPRDVRVIGFRIDTSQLLRREQTILDRLVQQEVAKHLREREIQLVRQFPDVVREFLEAGFMEPIPDEKLAAAHGIAKCLVKPIFYFASNDYRAVQDFARQQGLADWNRAKVGFDYPPNAVVVSMFVFDTALDSIDEIYKTAAILEDARLRGVTVTTSHRLLGRYA